MKKDAFFKFALTLALFMCVQFYAVAQRCSAARTTDFAVPAGTASTSNTRIVFTVQYDLDYRKMSKADRQGTYIAVVQFETTTTDRTREGEKPTGTEFRGVATQIFRPATDAVETVTKSVKTTEGIPVNRLIREGSGYRRNARVLIFRVSDAELSRCTER